MAEFKLFKKEWNASPRFNYFGSTFWKTHCLFITWFDGKLATQQGKFNTVFLSSFQYFMCSVALKVPKLKCFYASGRLFDCLFSLLITGGILSVLVLFQKFLVKEFEKADAISTAFLICNICNTCPKFFRTGNFLLAVAIIFCIQHHKNFDT